MEIIDGWEVDVKQGIATQGDFTLGGPDAGDPTILVNYHGVRSVRIPIRVARILLGNCEDCQAWQAGAEESRECMHELAAGIAALTGTDLERRECSCGGHLSAEAHAQIKAAQSGWTAPGALPWRPAVGGRCHLFAGGEWRLVERIEDEYNGVQRYRSLTASHAVVTWFEVADYDGVRPLGSLPAPASVRAKAEGVAK